MFDAIKYFESRGIDYHLAPEKNVSRGWVNITCPFPGCDDHSWHCGVNPEKRNFSCWKCKSGGHVAYLIKEIEKSSERKAWKIFESFSGGSKTSGLRHHFPPFQSLTASTKGLVFPRLVSKDFPRLYLEYLRKRKFDPDYLINKYDLYAGPKLGSYNYRIIIPIYYKKRIVSFTSRDVTDLSDIPYLHSRIDHSIIDPKRCIYNYDRVRKGKLLLIVEGVFDVWRIGNGTVCIFGTEFTWEQVEMVLDKEPSEIITLFDSDASDKGYRLASQFNGLGYKTRNFIIDREDPDKLDKADLLRIRKILDGREVSFF